MNTLIILFAQTKTTASLEILSLLLGSVIIGFLTARFYYKSLSVKKIKAFETEKAGLNRENGKLKADMITIFNTNSEKEREIKQLTQEILGLKALHFQSVNDKRSEQLLNEKDEDLTNIAQNKHLLD